MEELSSSQFITGLNIADHAVVIFLVGIMVAIGWWVSRRETATTESFFLGSRHVPGWAACLSFVATEVSAMTIVGVPADAFRSNWNYAQFFIGSALARIVIAYLFIPAFYATRYTTIYELLRDRFGANTQYCATSFFFLTRLLASGVRLYIASMAVSAILGVSLLPTVIAFTIVPILFIGFGGMRAVIWTSVMQALVFLGAGWVVLGFMHFDTNGGLGAAFGSAFPIGADAAARAAQTTIPAAQAVFATAAETGSRVPYFFNLTWSHGEYGPGVMGTLFAIFGNGAVLWGGIIAGLFTSLASFGTDQENVQRLLCVETRRQSQRMILWTIIAGGLVLLTYLAIGSGLAAWYQAHPGMPLPENTDKIFPHFIANVLPHGLKGLLLGAIILASIDSPLVSLATSMVTDFYRPLIKPVASEEHYVQISRVAIVFFGICLGILALFFSQFEGIIWVALKIGSVTFGSLLGVFLYGLLVKRPVGNAPIPAMVANALFMATLLYLIETKRVWLAWTWLPVFGTGVTMGLTWVFAQTQRVKGHESSAEVAPLGAAPRVAE